MFDILTYSIDKIQIFFLILIRTSGLFIIAPIFSNLAVSTQVKVSIALVLTVVLMSALNNVNLTPVNSMVELAGLAFKELLVGAIIGLVFMLIFMGVQGAGSIVGYQMGMYIASSLDPMTQGQTSLLGTFWTLLATLVFVTINGQLQSHASGAGPDERFGGRTDYQVHGVRVRNRPENRLAGNRDAFPGGCRYGYRGQDDANHERVLRRFPALFCIRTV